MRLTALWRVRAERGDTIVEVLISIAVVSMVLGGAYASTTRSLMATRDAQEHSDALKLVESQVEQVKGLAANSPDKLFDGTAPASYCVVGTTLPVAGTSSCTFNAAGGIPSGTEPKYAISISRAGNTFTIENRWTTIKSATAKETMKYRVYK